MPVGPSRSGPAARRVAYRRGDAGDRQAGEDEQRIGAERGHVAVVARPFRARVRMARTRASSAARTGRTPARRDIDRATGSVPSASCHSPSRHPLDGRSRRWRSSRADAGRGHDRAPVLELDVHPLLAQRRDVEAGKTVGARDGQRAQRAGLHVRRELGKAVDADGDLAADNRRERLAAAGERDVVDATWRHAHGFGHQAGEHLIASAGRPPAPRDRFGTLLEYGDEVGQRAKRRRGWHRDHLVLAGQPRDRCDVPQRHRRAVHHDAAEHDEARHHHRVAAATLGADEPGEADRARRSWDVFYRRRCTMPARWSTCCITRAV